MGAVALALVVTATAGAGVGCSDDGGDLDAYCATAQRFVADNPADAFTRIGTGDPAAAASTLRDAGERLAEWAGQAPGEIDDDVDTLVDAATTLAEQFEALANDESSDTPAVEVPAVEEASRRVLEFTRTQCEVDLEPAP